MTTMKMCWEDVPDVSDLHFSLTRNTLSQSKFEEWLKKVQDRMATMKRWQSAQLLEVDRSDGSGRIKAHFNNELVVLLTEVRQLKCLGFKTPVALDREVKVAEKFYHHGMMLQQVRLA